MGWTERQLREDNSGIYLEALVEAKQDLEERTNRHNG